MSSPQTQINWWKLQAREARQENARLRARVALLEAALKSFRKVLASDEDDCFPGTVAIIDEILLKSAEMN